MDVEVRSASGQDVEALAGLSRIVLDWHAKHYPADFRADPDIEELKAFFLKQIADRDTRLAIAEINRDPVGYVFFRRRPQEGSAFTPPKGTQLFVEHLVVVAGLRRQGVGTALMTYVEAEREDGSEIALETMNLNSGAQAFFSAQGFQVTALALRKRFIAADRDG